MSHFFPSTAFNHWVRKLFALRAVLGIAAVIGGCNLPGTASEFTPIVTHSPPAFQPISHSTATLLPPTAEPALPPESLWVINVMDGTLVHIDPVINEVIGGLKPDGVPIAITSGTAGVWAVARMTDKMVNILQIDPQTYRVAAIVPLQLEDIRDLTSSEHAVWAAAVRTGADGVIPLAVGTEFVGDLIRIDPSTHSVAALLPLTASPRQVLYQEEALWLLEDTRLTSRFTRINPATQQNLYFPLSNPTADYLYQFSRFARCASSMWAISVDSLSRYIYRVDPKDGRLANIIELGENPDDTPVDLTATEESVWAALRSGFAVEIDPQTNQVIQRTSLNSTPDRIFSAAGSIWVQSHTGAVLIRIDPTSGEVLAKITTGSMLRPTSTPWPELSPGEVCQGDYPTHLALYGRAMVIPDPPVPNRVRSEPNQRAEVVGEVQPGQGMTIIEGPVCTDGWIWWKVQADNTNLIGWTAEGDGDNYWLAPK